MAKLSQVSQPQTNNNNPQSQPRNINTRLDNDTAQDVVFGNFGIDEQDLADEANAAIGGDEDGAARLPAEEPPRRRGQQADDDEGDDRQELAARQEGDEGNDEERAAADLAANSPTRIADEILANNQPTGLPVYKIDPKTQNLIDPKTGKVIAKSGNERRFYQDLVKTKNDHVILTKHAGQLQQNVDRAVKIGRELVDANTALRRQWDGVNEFKLNPAELRQAAQTFDMIKKNPVEGVKRLLTQLAAGGINIQELGIATGGLDVKALTDGIREEFRREFAPLAAERQASQAAKAEETRNATEFEKINTNIRAFFDANPAAKPYVPTIEKLLSVDPNMTLPEAWLRVQLHLRDNPPRQQQQDNRRGPNNGQRPPANNGRRSPPVTRQNGEFNSNSDQIAPIGSSYKDILSAILDEQGIT